MPSDQQRDTAGGADRQVFHVEPRQFQFDLDRLGHAQAEVHRIPLRLLLRVEKGKRHAGFAYAQRDGAGVADALQRVDLDLRAGVRRPRHQQHKHGCGARQLAVRHLHARPVIPVRDRTVFEFGLRQPDVQSLHGVHRRHGRRLFIQCRGVVDAALAEKKDETVRVFDARDRRFGIELDGLFEMFERRILFRAVGHSSDEPAHLVDHLGLIRAIRDVCIGVLGVELQRGQQRVLDLAAEALRQRLRHRDALAVAPQRERIQVMCIRVLRRLAAALLRPPGGFLEQRELGLRGIFQVVGVHGLRLDRGVDAGAAGGEAGFDRLRELARVEMAPRREDIGVLRERLAIPAVQPRPVLLQAGRIICESLVHMRKLRPLLRHRDLRRPAVTDSPRPAAR